MRAVLLVLILAVVALIVAIASGFLDINQVRGAKAPDIGASRSGVTASGGQAPAFDIETGSVAVGTRDANVRVPQLQVNPPGNSSEPAQNQVVTNQAAPANSL